MRTTILLTLLTITTLATGQVNIEADPFGHELLNQTAPTFKARTLDSLEISLDDLKGKIVLLDFWSLSCGACFKEIIELNDIVKKYPKDKFVIVSIMDNTADELLSKFEIDKEGYKMKRPLYNNDRINYQIIPDGKDIMRLYTKHFVYPKAFIIDQKGIITLYFEGYAEEHGIPDEITTKNKLTKEIDRLLSASR